MAQTILDKIVATKRHEIAKLGERTTLAELERKCRDVAQTRDFLEPLGKSGNIRLIAEVKKASPSKGLIRENFEPVQIALQYQSAGASCLSVLTDVNYFQGDLAYLTAIRQSVSIPVLRKDFILDKLQIAEARVAGADAVLLIAECLNDAELKDLYQYARSLDLQVLVELYEEQNLPAVLETGARLIGVNNRDLRTFEVDLMHVVRLRHQIPSDRLVVAESGIHTAAEAKMLREHGIAAMLVGESLMRQADIAAATRRLLDTGIAD